MASNFATMSTLVVAALLVYLVYLTGVRLLGDGDDPTASVAAQSDTGSATFLLSGAWLIGAIVAVVSALTWPLAVEEPAFGALLGGSLVAHVIVERRERS